MIIYRKINYQRRSHRFLLLLFFIHTFYLLSVPRSVFTPRAAQTNIVHDFIIRSFDITKENNQNFSSSISCFYHHSFKNSRIADMVFGNSNFSISGSSVSGRLNTDLLADFFGLSQNFQGTITIKPTIITVVFLPNFSWKNHQHYFLRIYLPCVISRYDLNISEIKKNDTDNLFFSNYMAKKAVISQENFTQALTVPQKFGNVNKLAFGKINTKKTKSGLSQIRIEAGKEFCYSPLSHISFWLIGSIPIESVPQNEFIFEPVIGNRKHAEIGIGISGSSTIFDSAIRTIRIHAATHLTHLIKKKEQRPFDLKNNSILNRYMLAKIFDENTGKPTGEIIPLINATMLSCSVRTNIQMDALLACSIVYNKKIVAIGYNAYLKSRDVVKIKESISENKYALKGIQNVFNGETVDSFTESNATIFGSLFIDQEKNRDTHPIFITNQDLDTSSASMPFQLTHKFFCSLEVSLKDCGNYFAFFNIGAEIEFEGFNLQEEIDPSKSTLNQCGLLIGIHFEF